MNSALRNQQNELTRAIKYRDHCATGGPRDSSQHGEDVLWLMGYGDWTMEADMLAEEAKPNRYDEFLKSKQIVAESVGHEVQASEIHSMLSGDFQFESDITRWALKLGRAAVFLDCGLGKSFIQCEWARNIHRITGQRVLIVAPLSVAEQTIREAAKIGLAVHYADSPARHEPIVITNYEMLHAFAGSPFGGIVLDESSILKSIDGATRNLLLSRFTAIPYRLCCTATPCPNDIAELANHAEFLGVMKRNELLASFFVHDQDGWRMRGHAAKAFFRWLASWAIAMKSPADLGYDASRFALPPLEIVDQVVSTEWRKSGELFPGRLEGITDRCNVRKRSVADRVRRAADLAIETEGQVIVACGLNCEAEMCAAAIPGTVEIKGTDTREYKADMIRRFVSGEIRVLVSKARMIAYGLNLQNAHTLILVGLSDSYELYYQIIRRVWRYGQKRSVRVHVVVTDHESEIVENVRRKEVEAEALSRSIIQSAKEYEMEQLGRTVYTEVIDEAHYAGEKWKLFQGDCIKGMASMIDNSIDLSVFSPPFLSLYQYSASNADMGISKDHKTFFRHFGFMIGHLLRITKPGREACVHVAQVPTTLVNHGVIGIQDFRGKTITAFQDAGWVYHGEVCIDKDPQAQAIRTKAKSLLFVQLKKDASWLRPALADYILVFRKPGENAVPIHPDISNNEWIEWARPIWYGIRESETLNTAEARSDEDDRHICALQLGTIERCIRLWSNAGETVFSPFAGIGSEGYEAIRLGRKFIGCELKPLYASTAAKNLREAEREGEQQAPLAFTAESE